MGFSNLLVPLDFTIPNTLGIIWEYLWNTLSIPLEYFGNTLGIIWEYLWNTLAIPWEYFGITLCQRFGITLSQHLVFFEFVRLFDNVLPSLNTVVLFGYEITR